MRTRLTFLLTGALVLAMAIPAFAITNGARDAEDDDTYEAVGNLLFYVPDAVDPRFEAPGSWFTCSGTLIEVDVVVTAGHCTYGIGLDGDSPEVDENDAVTLLSGGTDVWITFEADARAKDDDGNDRDGAYAVLPNPSSYYAELEAESRTDDDPDNDDYDGNAARYHDWSDALDEADDHWHEAVAHSHPQYVDAAFFLYDLGVLALTEPATQVDASEFAELPEEGALDDLQNKRRNDLLFTAVGYGIQEIVPFFESIDVRYEAPIRLLTTKGAHGINGIQDGTSVVFSNNNGKAARGGTCFGDSGGPIFFGVDHAPEGGQTLAGVTSYGVSPNCTGTGGVYRIDKAADLDFIGTFLD